MVNTQKYNYTYQPSPADKENIDPNWVGDEKQGKMGVWENTNRMLGEGWSGIKTGITPNAGPCLAASYLKTISGKQYEFLVILLCSESMEARWNEVRSLVSWISENKLYK